MVRNRTGWRIRGILIGILFAAATSQSWANERGPAWSATRNDGETLEAQYPAEELPARNAPRGYGAPSSIDGLGFEEYPSSVYPAPSNPTRSFTPRFADPGRSFVDLTAPSDEPWDWQILPTGIVYKSYLASQKDSRFATQFNHIPERDDHTFWEPTLGARVGLLRFGDQNPVLPQGFQIDAEGSAQTRLNLSDDVDVTSVDFRGGLPLTYGYGPWRLKFGYYHLSSHLGDEFLLKNPNYPRLNFARDVLILGGAYHLTDDLRIYAEIGWAFYTDVSEPWEVQFGIDYAPTAPTGIRGAPFFAINGHLRQELDFSGNFTVQAGWAWRSAQNGSLLRMGGQYFNGASWQYSFYNHFEQQLGLGVWYDF